MIRVVFLDVDGVLNSTSYYERKLATGGFAEIYDQIDPECILRLNRLLKAGDLHIVMSSTWRSNITKTRQLCRRIGIRPVRRFIGVTPSLARQRESGVFTATERGHEIQAWLNAHLPQWPVESIVILDDDDDMVHLAPRLVRTDHRVGLTDADVDRVLALLR